MNFFRRITLGALHHLGVNWIFRKLNQGRKLILSFHSVLPDDVINYGPIDGMSQSESSFISQIDFISSKFRIGVDIHNADEVTLTFDDCRSNQKDLASKILADRGLSGIFFFPLISAEPDSPRLQIDDILFWISFAPKGIYGIQVRPGDRPIHLNLTDVESRHEVWGELYTIHGNELWDISADIICQMDGIYPFEILRKDVGERYFKLRMMPINRQGIEAMKSQGHLIGAHAYSHHPLSSLQQFAMEDEIRRCRAELGATFNSDVFCYPFGGLKEVSKMVIETVESFGFSCGLSNMSEPIDASSGVSYGTYFIPRIALPNTSSLAEINFVLSGTKHFLKHRTLLPRFQ